MSPCSTSRGFHASRPQFDDFFAGDHFSFQQQQKQQMPLQGGRDRIRSATMFAAQFRNVTEEARSRMKILYKTEVCFHRGSSLQIHFQNLEFLSSLHLLLPALCADSFICTSMHIYLSISCIQVFIRRYTRYTVVSSWSL